MKTIHLICVLFLGTTSAQASTIEIMAGGKAYASMQEYRASKAPQNANTISLISKADQAARAQLNAIGIESRVRTLISNFDQNWDDPTPTFTIKFSELEHRLKAELDGRKEPVLLLSDSNKLRVMALEQKRPEEGSVQ